MGLGLKIRQLRAEKKQSLQLVADAVGVSKAHIWELEKERTDNPSLALVTRLADHFNVSIHYLVDEDISAPGVDDAIARMCRLARNLQAPEIALLNDMVTSMLKHKASAGKEMQAA